ncbi:hypothetical protein MPY17_25315 [Rhodococcus opacus]|uniref:hypothetical protein n=1 Tax=Rhodococcus opacus TaxID=37919 RepID=UPI001FF44608|nr:hypothetical protein [Rhodococcus opacus]UOT02271.1 hypothetical protein MPY17_25315 [Rhodococcus opacus]
MPRGSRDDPWTREAEAAVKDYRRRSRLRGNPYTGPGSSRHMATDAMLARREQARRAMASTIEWLRAEYADEAAP